MFKEEHHLYGQTLWMGAQWFTKQFIVISYHLKEHIFCIQTLFLLSCQPRVTVT